MAHKKKNIKRERLSPLGFRPNSKQEDRIIRNNARSESLTISDYLRYRALNKKSAYSPVFQNISFLKDIASTIREHESHNPDFKKLREKLEEEIMKMIKQAV